MLDDLPTTLGTGCVCDGSEYKYGPAIGGGVHFGRGLGSKTFKIVALDEIETGPIRMYTPLDCLTNISVTNAVMLVKYSAP